ncbi:hypothetical protein MKW94_020278 [Papaver nudicaule]|uniref:Uncharacterized protein n=1 Tax=Papaver nudicaule TaxID=74823 RepID=A0AA41S871_PAPNU|nr:hypothetical protein [Papaver nudicaule]
MIARIFARKGGGKQSEPVIKELPSEEYLWQDDERGSIVYYSKHRPPVPLDIFSCAIEPTSTGEEEEELGMTDGKSYNYSGCEIPAEALIKLLNYSSLASLGNQSDVNLGRISGTVFVSERDNLELLYIAIRLANDDGQPPMVEVHSLADVFLRSGSQFNGVRMEDSGCFTHDNLIYVSTKRPATNPRQPWSAVYKTHLKTGQTQCLTPSGLADFNPSVSPSKKMIAVASYVGMDSLDGLVDHLKTDIYVVSLEEPYARTLVVENGGWPTWGSDTVIFFHRKEVHSEDPYAKHWGVHRVDINIRVAERITPEFIDAFTPAAVNDKEVVVVTVREEWDGLDTERDVDHFRQIEIFDANGHSTKVTANTKSSKTDHFSPFVIGNGKRVGYHRSTSDPLDEEDDFKRQIQIVPSPHAGIGLFRVGGGFPTFSKDVSGYRLAFIDNDSKSIRVLDNEGLHELNEPTPNSVFPPVWNQNDKLDTLYVCGGPSSSADATIDIYAIRNVSSGGQVHQLTEGFDNAFPSSNPDGDKIVYRSTRDGCKNLYIMDANEGVIGGVTPHRLTNGDWTDTQCQWSPRGNWIVFLSSRPNPPSTPEKDNDLEPGHFGVYLVDSNNPDVVVRVIASGSDFGHVNHPCFSPDGLSIVMTSDVAVVSVDPISLPLLAPPDRPYGDIITIDIDPDDITKNGDLKTYKRITHSKYENSACTWTGTSTEDATAVWNLLQSKDFSKAIPRSDHGGDEVVI